MGLRGLSFTNHSLEESGCHNLSEEISQGKPQMAKKREEFFFPFLVPKLKMLLYDKMQICCCSFTRTKSLQSGSTVCNPADCSPPGSSVLGILQARIMEWVAMPSSRESSWLRDRTHLSMSPALAGIFFMTSVIPYAGIPFSVNL